MELIHHQEVKTGTEWIGACAVYLYTLIRLISQIFWEYKTAWLYGFIYA